MISAVNPPSYILFLLTDRFYPEKTTYMKTIFLLILVITAFASCNRALTPNEAANHHYKKCRDIR